MRVGVVGVGHDTACTWLPLIVMTSSPQNDVSFVQEGVVSLLQTVSCPGVSCRPRECRPHCAAAQAGMRATAVPTAHITATATASAVALALTLAIAVPVAHMGCAVPETFIGKW